MQCGITTGSDIKGFGVKAGLFCSTLIIVAVIGLSLSLSLLLSYPLSVVATLNRSKVFSLVLANLQLSRTLMFFNWVLWQAP